MAAGMSACRGSVVGRLGLLRGRHGGESLISSTSKVNSVLKVPETAFATVEAGNVFRETLCSSPIPCGPSTTSCPCRTIQPTLLYSW
ncbi:hypothetical protein M407DRAFT_241554 [Tulasnella calospora MUT 4182]|uniref:Uncharacterized protein n=1 Tax=Tulasnella calospora MUT 4182 TaxID=1051891 RepID=A0A0C3MEC9_9AGAM|nr:hypothetical protein M407DRAFT_241554 [Tulasnella calospora MUT 4182]